MKSLTVPFCLRANRFDLALEQYQAGAKEGQKNALHYRQRIVTIYSIMSRRDDAIHVAKQLAEKNPKDTSTNQMYALLLLETGLKTDAAKSLVELKGLVQKKSCRCRATFGPRPCLSQFE
jgi:hypothetical protein